MPRKPLIKTHLFPYHIMSRSNNRERFYLPLEELWPLFLEVCSDTQKLYKPQFHGLILMSNHYHLVMDFPQANPSECTAYLHREVARRSNLKCGRINHFWGGRYKWSLINTSEYYWTALKYVFRNPVKANICRRVEDYPYSTLNQYFASGLFRQVDFFSECKKLIELNLDWLNQSFSEEQNNAIARGLRKPEFQLGKTKSLKRVNFTNERPIFELRVGEGF